MTSLNFDFAYIGEKIIEPVFRTLTNVAFIKTMFAGMEKIENDLNPVYYNRQKEIASWASPKLQFEYILNNEFNISGYTNPIYIQNIPNSDLDMFAYNINEETYKPLFIFNDSNTTGFYNNYGPFNSYVKGDIVRFGTLLYIARVNNPIPNSLFNTQYWLPISYGYNDFDTLSVIDFVVWVPTSLFQPDFDLAIKSFINEMKLFNISYVVQYY